MIATIKTVLQETNGVRVIVDFEGFGQMGFVFPKGTDKPTVRQAIRNQKNEFNEVIQTRESIATLIGEEI